MCMAENYHSSQENKRLGCLGGTKNVPKVGTVAAYPFPQTPENSLYADEKRNHLNIINRRSLAIASTLTG